MLPVLVGPVDIRQSAIEILPWLGLVLSMVGWKDCKILILFGYNLWDTSTPNMPKKDKKYNLIIQNNTKISSHDCESQLGEILSISFDDIFIG